MNMRTIFLNKSQQHFIVDDEPSHESQQNKDDQYNILTADEFEQEVLQCKIHQHLVYYFKLFRLEAEQVYVLQFQKDFVETIEHLLSQGDIPSELFSEIVWATHRLLLHTYHYQQKPYVYISFFASLSQELQFSFITALPCVAAQVFQDQLSKDSFCSVVRFTINVLNYDELVTSISPQMSYIVYNSSIVRILILNLIFTFGYFFDTQLRLLQSSKSWEQKQEHLLFAQVKPIIDLGLVNLQQIINLKTNQFCSSFHCSAIEAIGIYFSNKFAFDEFLTYFDYQQYNYFIMSIMRESLRYQITSQTSELLCMTILVQQQLIYYLQMNDTNVDNIEQFIEKEFIIICIKLLQQPFRKLSGAIDSFFIYALPYFSTCSQVINLLNNELLNFLKLRVMNNYQIFSTIGSVAEIIGFDLLSDDRFIQFLQENSAICEAQYLLEMIFQNCRLEEHE